MSQSCVSEHSLARGWRRRRCAQICPYQEPECLLKNSSSCPAPRCKLLTHCIFASADEVPQVCGWKSHLTLHQRSRVASIGQDLGSPDQGSWDGLQGPRQTGADLSCCAEPANHYSPGLQWPRAPGQGPPESKLLRWGLGPHPFTCWHCLACQTAAQCVHSGMTAQLAGLRLPTPWLYS